MNGDFPPLEQRACQRQEDIGQHVAFKIRNQQGAPGDAVHRTQQHHHLIVLEMVEEERANDKIETSRCKRKRKSIRHNFGRKGRGKVNGAVVEVRNGSVWQYLADDSAGIA